MQKIKDYVIVGLGNPGEEYTNTRHNVGRMVVDAFRKAQELPEWETDKKLRALSTSGKIEKTKVLLLEPETFMNDSGKSLTAVSPALMTRKITKGKSAKGGPASGGKFYESLVVVHDDIDLPMGTIRISWNRGMGGHNGLKSIVKVLGSEAFTRVRVGISKVTSAGQIKKPAGEEAVINFILGKFSKTESEEFKKNAKRAAEAISAIIKKGRDCAMGEFNR